MPQLNPSPWFLTLLISWLIFLLLLIPKISSTFLPTPPKQESDMKPSTPWTWPWS